MKDELKAALIYAASVRATAIIEGMKAENQYRVICENQIAYGDESFINVAEELSAEIERLDRIETQGENNVF